MICTNCSNKDLQRRKKRRQDNTMLIFVTHLKSLKFSKKAVLTLCQLRQLLETVACDFHEKCMQI